MCAKNLKKFSRVILLSLVLWALVLAPASAAWPFFFGSKEAEVSPTLSLPEASSQEEALQATILSLQNENEQLQKELTESKKMLEIYNEALEKSEESLRTVSSTLPAQEKLADGVMAEILRLREDTEELHLAKQNIEEAYDALLEEYQAKHAESESYYLQAVDTTAKLNAIKPKKLITTTLGTAAVYHQGSYGIDVTAGVNFGPAGVFVGATYMFGEDSFLAMGDMAYKAGLTFTF